MASDVTDKLADGCFGKILHEVETSKHKLTEINDNQQILIDAVQQENSKYEENENLQEFQQLMDRTKSYYAKLVKIKKDMHQLHEKSSKLKKRALALQQKRRQSELQQQRAKERQQERERRLAAQPAQFTPGSTK